MRNQLLMNVYAAFAVALFFYLLGTPSTGAHFILRCSALIIALFIGFFALDDVFMKGESFLALVLISAGLPCTLFLGLFFFMGWESGPHSADYVIAALVVVADIAVAFRTPSPRAPNRRS